MLHATLQVMGFEGRRTCTRGRLAIWIALAFFPSLLMILLQSQARATIPDEPLALICYYLVVQVGCMLGLLLWATPAVGSELEAQTWIYLAMRPRGKVAIVLGKYIVAVAWTASAGVISAVGVSFASDFQYTISLAGALIALVLMASFCYAALYILIGVTLSSRATVIAVVYTLLIEGVLSMVPATINQFTVCYRLRALLVNWLEISVPSDARNILGYEPAWQHITCLALYTAVVLVLALWIMRTKEFPVSSDS